MDFLKRIQSWLLTLRAWIRKIHDALPNHAESQDGAHEGERGDDLSYDRVRAVVSFDDETIRTTQAAAERQYTTQKSIKNATWGAFVAASIYALITTLMWCQMIKQTRIASAALRQSTESFRVGERAWIEIEPIKGTLYFPRTEKIGADFQYPIYIRNVGKTVARDIQLRGSRQGSQSSIAMGDSAEALNWEQDKLLLGKVPTAADIPVNNPVPKVLAPNTSSAVPVVFMDKSLKSFPKSK